MSDIHITAYADSLLLIAGAEGDSTRVESELFELGRAMETNEELRATLTDARIPVERRAQVVEDVLGAASAVTKGAASLMVLTGRAADIPAVAAEMGRRAAEATGATVADVRSAVALTEEQTSRLAEALSARLGRTVTIRNIVDPTVIGGVVTQIGDQVIDGSVRSRLNQLREAF